MTESVLNEIADWCLGDESVSFDFLEKFPGTNLKIKITNNVPEILSCEILSDGEIEQRQESIFRMVLQACQQYKIEDLILIYCTTDRNYSPKGIFSHARLAGTNNLIAPCFTFDGYYERAENIFVDYKTSHSNLISSKMNWENKEKSCCFVGHVGDNNYRDYNTSIELSDIKMKIYNQQSTSQNFINREDLTKFKYLLHLNGNQGAYASRFKYLLGTGSLVFYNYDSGSEKNFWEEWWMMPKYFKDGIHFISSKDKFEFKNIIENLSDNDCKTIAENGFEFFKNLKSEIVIKFWSVLLNKYSKKITY